MAANQTLTESTLVDLQVRINQMFQGDTPSEYQLNEPALTFGALAERNQAIINPTLQGEDCVSVDVHYLIADTQTISRVDGEWDLDCDLENGRAVESAKKTYETDALAIEVADVSDAVCGSLFNDAPNSLDGQARARTILDRQLLMGMRKLRTSLNTIGTAFLETARTTVDSDDNKPAYLTWNAGSSTYEADSLLFQTPDFLTDIDATVANSNIANYFMLSGRSNFYNSVINSQFRVRNDNERFLIRYANYDMAFDIRELSNVTYAIGDGTYALWNATVSPILPFQIDYDKWRFSIQDPVLVINQNGILRPVIYEVVYQRLCEGRDARTNHTFEHKFEIKFMGGLDSAPVPSGGNTGILKFTSIAGV